MPIYVFRGEDGEEVERIFPSWRGVPAEINLGGARFRRVPARFNSRFPTAEERENKRRGLVPIEPGMDRDARRAKKHREEIARIKSERALDEALYAAMS